jgi:hypothetical protein
MITYRLNPSFDSSIHESRLLKDVHYFVSDDTSPDTLYLQHAFMLQWEFLIGQGYYPTHHIVWLFGCQVGPGTLWPGTLAKQPWRRYQMAAK